MKESCSLENVNTESPKYWAFISYRHADNIQQNRQWAIWLHHLLETYEIPADLVGMKNDHGEIIPDRIFPVFRDEEELPVNANLTKPIYEALDTSRALIVICSPRAVNSRYVIDEINYFKGIGKYTHIMAVIIDGEPNVTDDKEKRKSGFSLEDECFPAPLRISDGTQSNNGPIEPIAADFRIYDPFTNTPSQGWTSCNAYRNELKKTGKLRKNKIDYLVKKYNQQHSLMRLKIIAGVLGVPLGLLTKRDVQFQLEKEKKRRKFLVLLVAIISSLTFIAAIGGFFSLNQWDRIRKISSQSDFMLGCECADKNDYLTAVSYWVRSLTNNPENDLAKNRLSSHLLYGNIFWPVLDIGQNYHGFVRQCEFSNDEKYVITASKDSTARIWEIATGKQYCPPFRHYNNVNYAVFSPDCRLVVTASDDSTAQIWDVASGVPLKSLKHRCKIDEAFFSQDGSLIATFSKWNGASYVWDASSGRLLIEDYMNAFITNISISPDNRFVIINSDDGMSIWDIPANHKIASSLSSLRRTFNCIEFSSDGKYVLATPRFFDQLNILDLQTKNWKKKLHKIDGEFSNAKFSRDGKSILAFHYSNSTINVLCTQTGNNLLKINIGRASLSDASFSPDGKMIVTSCGDGIVDIWNAHTGEKLTTYILSNKFDQATKVTFSHDGKYVMAIANGCVNIRSAQVQNAISRTIKAEVSWGKDATFSPDGKQIATASRDSTVRVWDVHTGEMQYKPYKCDGIIDFLSYKNDVLSLITLDDKFIWAREIKTGNILYKYEIPCKNLQSYTFSQDGYFIAGSCDDSTVNVWNAQTGKSIVDSIKLPDDVGEMEYSRDGRYFATTTTGWLRDSTEISIWETKNWQLLFSQWLKNEGMTSLQFSPDGNFLLAHTYWQNLYIWNLKEKKLIQNPIGIVEGITGMEFSSDGKYLIGNYIDNITRIWDFSTGMLVNSIKHSQKINSSVLSPDERFFLTSSDDGILRLYDPITGNMVCETDNSSSKPIHDISFDPDGKWVLAVNEDDSIQLFDFGFLYEGNVKQLCIIAQILNNNMVNDNLIMQTPTNKLINEYKKLKQSCSLNAKLDPVVKWLLSSPLERPISPFSK